MKLKMYRPVAVLAGILILIQLTTLATGTAYYLTQMTMAAYYVIVAVGLSMVMGYAGQISLGQAGFFAIGGYTTAVLTTMDLSGYLDRPFFALLDKTGLLISRQTLYGESITYLTPWISFILSLILAGTVAYLIGVPVLRLKGHYLGMATMGFGIIIYRIVLGTSLFGEADGITNVPEFPLIPGITIGGDFSIRVVNYYTAWVFVIIAMVLLMNLVNSRVGRALRSLHGGEDAADAMGVDTARYKVSVFVIGAVFAAAAGVFMTHYNGGIGPSESSVTKSVRYVAIVAVGGMANLWGVLVMGLVLNFLSLRGLFGAYDDAVFGVILVIIMMFFPDGLFRISVVSKLKTLFAGRFGRKEDVHDE
jgi:branched-chain amino acid transport system permease protein